MSFEIVQSEFKFPHLAPFAVTIACSAFCKLHVKEAFKDYVAPCVMSCSCRPACSCRAGHFLLRSKSLNCLPAVVFSAQACSRFVVGYLRTMSTLPILEHLDSIFRRLMADRIVAVSSDPGSGKSTALPEAFIKMTFFDRICVLGPNTFGVKRLAERVAGADLGGLVGYKTEDGEESSWRTRLMFKTYGVELAQLQHKQLYIAEHSLYILDEIHQNAPGARMNLFMAFLKEHVLPQSSVKVLLLTATHVPRMAGYLFATKPDIYTITTPAETMRSIEFSDTPLLPKHAVERVTDSIWQLLGYSTCMGWIMHEGQWQRKGGILVFLPGEAEIYAALAELKKWNMDLDLRVLFSSMSGEDWKRLNAPVGDSVVIILATNVAESSVTFPFISCVVDAGLYKRLRVQNGVAKLLTEFIGNVSATQRAGRAGRTHYGWAYRLYTAQQLADAERQFQASMVGHRDDSAEEVLFCKGASLCARQLPYSPSDATVVVEERRLVEQGLLEQASRVLSNDGCSCHAIPIGDVQLKVFLLRAWEFGCVWDGIAVASMLHHRVLSKDHCSEETCQFTLLARIFKEAWEVFGDEAATRTLCTKCSLHRRPLDKALWLGQKLWHSFHEWPACESPRPGDLGGALCASFSRASYSGRVRGHHCWNSAGNRLYSNAAGVREADVVFFGLRDNGGWISMDYVTPAPPVPSPEQADFDAAAMPQASLATPLPSPPPPPALPSPERIAVNGVALPQVPIEAPQTRPPPPPLAERVWFGDATGTPPPLLPSSAPLPSAASLAAPTHYCPVRNCVVCFHCQEMLPRASFSTAEWSKAYASCAVVCSPCRQTASGDRCYNFMKEARAVEPAPPPPPPPSAVVEFAPPPPPPPSAVVGPAPPPLVFPVAPAVELIMEPTPPPPPPLPAFQMRPAPPLPPPSS